MLRIRIGVVAVVVSIGMASIGAQPALAQTSDAMVSTPASSSTPKETLKAQRKAQRKAARAKRNAELKELEKNGFNPTSDQDNYPQNIQNSERKTAKSKAAEGASASGK
ncbi:DUF4148 domain-containing protein [Trinickia mobilis]|uniref:DUF4148 domain-containing protein n=1 Tax=Trinickia mobilis TaxID=2816356 RepID=UPI001A906D7A|nr:DUF4148 domain-containing protein [Trinickia mobilis]